MMITLTGRQPLAGTVVCIGKPSCIISVMRLQAADCRI